MENNEKKEVQKQRRRVSSRDKATAVLRVLAGETVQHVSTEIDVSARRLNEWKETFVDGGVAALQAANAENMDSSKSVRRTKAILFGTAAGIIGLTVLILAFRMLLP